MVTHAYPMAMKDDLVKQIPALEVNMKPSSPTAGRPFRIFFLMRFWKAFGSAEGSICWRAV